MNRSSGHAPPFVMASTSTLAIASMLVRARQRLFSVGGKLAIVTVIVLSIVSASVFFELSRRERARLVDAKTNAAVMVAELFAASLVPLLDFDDAKGVDAELTMLGANREVRRAAVWSGAKLELVRKRTFGGFVEDEAATAPLVPRLHAPLVAAESLVVVHPVVASDGRQLGVVAIELSLSDVNATYADTRMRLLIMSLLLVVGTAIVLIALSQRFVATPLHQLSEVARRFEKGDYALRPEVRSRDEIGQLGDAIGSMASAIVDREVRLTAATERLRELFDALRQGVVVVGRDGRVDAGASREAVQLFGGVVGKRLPDLLYPDDAAASQRINTWLDAAFDATPASWPVLAAAAPREIILQAGERLDVVLEFRPLFNDGKLERLMVLITDETEHRALERVVAEERREKDAVIRDAMQKMRAELERSREQIALKNRLEKEMEIATQIQTALLPPQRALRGLEIAAIMQTASEVGGDYYDIVPARDGGWLGIGDVSGHGLTAGLVMLMIQSTLATLFTFDSPQGTTPSDLVVRLNAVLHENVRHRLKQDDHATLTVARYREDGRLSFAGAHEPIIVVHADGTADIIETPGTWVGASNDVSGVTVNSELQLVKGDVVVFHTDGITEARSASGEPFGIDRLREEVMRARGDNVERVRDRVLEAVSRFSPERADDMTLVVARFVGASP